MLATLSRLRRTCLAALILAAIVPSAPADAAPAQISVDWASRIGVSRSTPTLQVVVNPKLEPGSPIAAPSFTALKALGANYVRFVPWFPYPRLAVAELSPPTSTGTSWDFSLVDPAAVQFADAAKGHPAIWNFSTMPAWMYKTQQPIAVPDDPNQVDWGYNSGNVPVDPSYGQIAAYLARVVSWYTAGGFTDENGKYHPSGHHFPIAIWEVLNEPEGEHQPTPQQYTAEYDAITAAIHRVSPRTRFMGLALAFINADTTAYFLDHTHHRPGAPLDWVSFHFYAQLPQGSTPDQWQGTLFAQADDWLAKLDQCIAVRDRLSPATRIDLDEIGTMLPGEDEAIPPLYWNASGALYAYVYLMAARRGVDVIGESQLVGYPSQYPDVSMVNWHTGQPNARFWTLKLLVDHFGSGDVMNPTSIDPADQANIAAQAFTRRHGKKLLLLINKRDTPVAVTFSGASADSIEFTDQSTGENPARTASVAGGQATLAPYAVAVVSFKSH